MPNRRIRVVVADDHAVVREALARMLSEVPEFEIVGEAPDGLAAIELVRQVLPDVVIMDMSMPGMNGIEATRIICAHLPNVRVIGLSMHGEEESGEEMRRAGAVDYYCKIGPVGALIDAIRNYGMAS